ncbi:MAG: cytochrome c [Minwuiales bacterium]|nr:cytochrome c [Minwuiales bacterium]
MSKPGNRFAKTVRLPAGLALAAGLCLSAATAWAQADPVGDGKRIAQKWCVNCHIVEAGSNRGGDTAPPFMRIANDPETTPERLRGFLVDPHPLMPNLDLTRQEIDAIIAYMQSLKAE